MIRRFRAWMIDNKKYWNGSSDSYLLSLEGGFLETVPGDAGEIENIRLSPDGEKRFIFEQSTGRLDRNAHEIFEGDRIRCITPNDPKTNFYDAVVEWSEDYLGWEVHSKHKREPVPHSKWIEIIGTAHEESKL